MSQWGSPEEIERHRRIKLAVCAWAYERMSESLISDAEFDRLCLQVDLTVDTGDPEMDKWWRENFSPHTGQWVNRHPNTARLGAIASQMLAWRKSIESV